MNSFSFNERTFFRIIALSMVLLIVLSAIYMPSSLAESGNSTIIEGSDINPDDQLKASLDENKNTADEVIGMINDLQVTTSADREAVVFARQSYNKLSKVQQDLVTNLELLEKAEAQIIKLWIDSAEVTSPVDEGLIGVLSEQYEELNEVQKSYVTNADKLGILEEKYEALKKIKEDNYIKAKTVQKLIEQMQVLKYEDKDEASKVRTAYDALTSDQKAIVTNYGLLKEAENKIASWEGKPLPHKAPTNIAYAGTRASEYGVSGEWLRTADWQHITDQMKGYFPDAQPTYVWIIGKLDGGVGLGGVKLEFEQPDDGVDYAAQNISFGPSTKPGHLSHEEYLSYFDDHGIKVILQVESGFADMKTLMDLIFKQYGHHKSVIGFGVDVEWYYGVSEDAGLPVTDELAEDWDKHLKTIDPSYRLMLKHYSTRWLPQTYRSDILFCNDSQSIGSIDGEVPGMYDDTMGFLPEFKVFADFFYPNDVLYQIGYARDAMWYYPLDTPVIQSLGERLAEVTKQKIGITWVDFTIKDPLTFPGLFKTDKERTDSVNKLLGYLDNSGSNMVGKRFASPEGGTLTDAMFVARVREVVDSLTGSQKEALKAKGMTNLLNLESKAIDIRLTNLNTAALKLKDEANIAGIRAAYTALTADQKEQVTQLTKLTAAEKALAVLKIGPGTGPGNGSGEGSGEGSGGGSGNEIGGGTPKGAVQPPVINTPSASCEVGKQSNTNNSVNIKASEIKKADRMQICIKNVKLNFDKAALNSMGSAADLQVSINQADISDLSRTDRQKIGDRPVFEISAQSDKSITNLAGGSVMVSIPYTPRFGEDTQAIVIYHIRADGTLEIVQNSVYDAAAGIVMFKTNDISRYAISYNKTTFTDVSGGALDAVTYLAAREIIKGKGDYKFDPEANINRAEFVQILAKMSQADLASYSTSVFSNVGTTDWYRGAVSWAYQHGIIDDSYEQFNPNASITRQDMAVMLARYVDKASTFPLAMVNEAIKATVTRAETAQIISGLIQGSLLDELEE